MQRRSGVVASTTIGGLAGRATRSKTAKANLTSSSAPNPKYTSKAKTSDNVKTTKSVKASSDLQTTPSNPDEDKTARAAPNDEIDWDEVPGVNVPQRPVRPLPRRARAAASVPRDASNEASSSENGLADQRFSVTPRQALSRNEQAEDGAGGSKLLTGGEATKHMHGATKIDKQPRVPREQDEEERDHQLKKVCTDTAHTIKPLGDRRVNSKKQTEIEHKTEASETLRSSARRQSSATGIHTSVPSSSTKQPASGDKPQKLIEPKKARLHGLDEGQQQELEELETGEPNQRTLARRPLAQLPTPDAGRPKRSCAVATTSNISKSMRTLKAWGNENAEEKLKENAKGKRKKVTLQDYFSQASSASNSSQDDSDHDSSAQEDELESELGFDYGGMQTSDEEDDVYSSDTHEDGHSSEEEDVSRKRSAPKAKTNEIAKKRKVAPTVSKPAALSHQPQRPAGMPLRAVYVGPSDAKKGSVAAKLWKLHKDNWRYDCECGHSLHGTGLTLPTSLPKHFASGPHQVWQHTISGYEAPAATYDCSFFMTHWTEGNPTIESRKPKMDLRQLSAASAENEYLYSEKQIEHAADVVQERLTKDYPLTLNELLPLIAHKGQVDSKGGVSLRPLFAQIVAHAICKVDSSTPPRYFGLLDAVAQVEHQLKLRAATTTQGDHHGPVEIALRQKIAQLPAANAQSLKIRAALASNVARDFCLRFGVDPDWLDDLAGKQTLNVQIPIGTVLLVPVAKFASSLSTYLSGSDLSGLLPQPRNTLFGLIRLTHIHHQRHRDVTGGAGGARVDWRAAFNQLWSEGGWPDKAAMLAELSKDGHSPGLDRLKIITQWDSLPRLENTFAHFHKAVKKAIGQAEIGLLGKSHQRKNRRWTKAELKHIVRIVKRWKQAGGSKDLPQHLSRAECLEVIKVVKKTITVKSAKALSNAWKERFAEIKIISEELDNGVSTDEEDVSTDGAMESGESGSSESSECESDTE